MQSEVAIIGTCTECDGRMVETASFCTDSERRATLFCQDCQARVDIEHELAPSGFENIDAEGVREVSMESVAWIDCPNCRGSGEVLGCIDDICHARGRCIHNGNDRCPACDGTGAQPRVTATDGGPQCTDKMCAGEATYALWMGEQFSRVTDAHETMPYDDGDLHPHVCESCLPRYQDRHGDKGEFVRPVEKLATDGGTRRPLAICGGCGKVPAGRALGGQCTDCGGRFVEATDGRLACDRCGDADASRVLNCEDYDRLCTDCVDWTNRENPECPDCGRRMIEVDSPETPGPQSWECPGCWHHVDADDQLVTDGGIKYDHIVEVPDRETQVPIECPGCGETFIELLSPKIGGSSCPDCGDMIEYVRPSERRDRGEGSEDDTEQTTLVTDGGLNSSDDYRGPDAAEVGQFERVFAPGDVAEWESALYELRELLDDLEDADLNDRRERREAEEALFHRFGEVELALRDAWGSRVNGGDQ